MQCGMESYHLLFLLHDRVLQVIVRSASMHAYIPITSNVPQRAMHGISLSRIPYTRAVSI